MINQIDKNSEILVEVTRGDMVESKHHGHIAVTRGNGELIAWAGNPDTVTFIRSAAKPMQAMNVILSGAQEHYNFTPQELAIMCSSHYGEDMHRAVLEKILKKIGLNHDSLLCGSPLSIKSDYRDRQLRENLEITELNSDCSGKHCGFLSVCKHKNYSIEDYIAPEHPMQQELLQIVARMCDFPAEQISIGVDGCGVPVHGLPLRNMAIGYAQISSPAQLEKSYRDACRIIYDAMVNNPEMIAGTGGFCTEFLAHTNRRFCGKLGAEAVYCIGVKDKNIGIAVKIEDGNYRALYPAVMSTLVQLDLLADDEYEMLRKFHVCDNRNDHGNVIGEIRPAFSLHIV